MFDLYREEITADCHVRITEIHVQLALQSLLDTQILARAAATTLCINMIYTVNKRITVDRNETYNVLFRLDMSTDLRTLIAR